jgi:hypothetical protein
LLAGKSPWQKDANKNFKPETGKDFFASKTNIEK